MRFPEIRRLLLAAVAVSCLAGPAVAQDNGLDDNVSEDGMVTNPDPFEETNRKIFAFNKAIDDAILKPVAKGYRAVLPAPVRTAVGNFFANLGEPLNLVNNLVQGKPERGASSVGRFLLNSTIGLAGFFDPASALGLPRAEEDFGQSIRLATESSGAYLMLPLLGPSTTEDAIGLVGDMVVESYTGREIFDDDATENVLTAVEIVDVRADILQAEEAVEGAIFDEYLFVRDAYLERRIYVTADEDQ